MYLINCRIQKPRSLIFVFIIISYFVITKRINYCQLFSMKQSVQWTLNKNQTNNKYLDVFYICIIRLIWLCNILLSLYCTALQIFNVHIIEINFKLNFVT